MLWYQENAKRLGIYLALMALAYFSYRHSHHLIALSFLLVSPSYCIPLILKSRLGSPLLNIQDNSLVQWLRKLLTAQWVFLLFSAGFFEAFVVNPIFKTQPAFTLTHFIHHYPAGWLAYPWSMWSLAALILCVLCYYQQKAPFFYQLLSVNSHYHLQACFKYLHEFITSRSTLFLITVILASIVLNAYSFATLFLPRIQIIPAVMILGLMLGTMALSFVIKLLKRNYRTQKFVQYAVIYMIFFTLSLLLLHYVIVALNLYGDPKKILVWQESLQLQSLFSKNAELRDNLLYWSWGFLWLPLAASYIALISQGRKPWQILLTIPVIGLLTQLFCYLLAHYSSISWLEPRESAGVLAVLSTIYLLNILTKIRNSDFLLTGFMPISDQTCRSRVSLQAASKKTGVMRYQLAVINALSAIIILLISTGYSALQWQLTAMVLILALWMFGYSSLFFYRLLSNRR